MIKKPKKKPKAGKLVSVYTDEETRQQLKAYSVRERITMTDATTTAIHHFLDAPEN